MIAQPFSTSSHREKLVPAEVEQTIRYAMGELERLGLLYIGPTGQAVFVGTSRKRVINFAKDALRVFGPYRARRTIDEHIQNLIQLERERNRPNVAPITDTKKKAPDAVAAARGENQNPTFTKEN